MVSQEQKNSIQQQEVVTDEKKPVQESIEETSVTATDEPGDAEVKEVYVDVPTASGKKRKKRKFRERLVYESEISPRPSAWPIALAFSIAVLLFGLVYNVYFLVAGVILVIVCILGWVLERQKA
jgi:uncharacterized protein YhaN